MASKAPELDLDLVVHAGELEDADYEWLAQLLVDLDEAETEQEGDDA